MQIAHRKQHGLMVLLPDKSCMTISKFVDTGTRVSVIEMRMYIRKTLHHHLVVKETLFSQVTHIHEQTRLYSM